MSNWLAAWGVSTTASFFFAPILEELATELRQRAKNSTLNLAEEYVKSCFDSVFSPILREPLSVATGRALKELLEEVQDRLIEEGLPEAQLERLNEPLRQFVHQDQTKKVIRSLFCDPTKALDPELFDNIWHRVESGNQLPAGFSWAKVQARLVRKVHTIRLSIPEVQEAFTAFSQINDSEAIQSLVGLPPEFDVEAYREAVLERYGNVNLDTLDTTGAYYNGVRLWNVFVPQSVRECHEFGPQLHEAPKDIVQRKSNIDKEYLELLLKTTGQRKKELAELEEHQLRIRHQFLNQPTRDAVDVCLDRDRPLTVV